VSNAGGLPELVQSGETGYVFEVDNINQLIDKLKILIFDPEKREIMKNNTRKSITEKINICDTIRDTSMLYHSLIT
jgi:glycosyltransferase involved in cell wall biosynthesis